MQQEDNQWYEKAVVKRREVCVCVCVFVWISGLEMFKTGPFLPSDISYLGMEKYLGISEH